LIGLDVFVFFLEENMFVNHRIFADTPMELHGHRGCVGDDE
jgi:hypothetical protein